MLCASQAVRVRTSSQSASSFSAATAAALGWRMRKRRCSMRSSGEAPSARRHAPQRGPISFHSSLRPQPSLTHTSPLGGGGLNRSAMPPAPPPPPAPWLSPHGFGDSERGRRTSTGLRRGTYAAVSRMCRSPCESQSCAIRVSDSSEQNDAKGSFMQQAEQRARSLVAARGAAVLRATQPRTHCSVTSRAEGGAPSAAASASAFSRNESLCTSTCVGATPPHALSVTASRPAAAATRGA
jgi:hypothetical protein